MNGYNVDFLDSCSIQPLTNRAATPRRVQTSSCPRRIDRRPKTLALSETKTQSRSLRSLAATTTDPSQPWALLSDSRVCPQVCIALYTTRRRSKPLLDGQARGQVCLRLIGGRCLYTTSSLARRSLSHCNASGTNRLCRVVESSPPSKVCATMWKSVCPCTSRCPTLQRAPYSFSIVMANAG